MRGGIQAVHTKLVKSLPGVDSNEGYVIDITPKGIFIKAKSEAGIFYAKETLAQIVGDNPTVRCMTIVDYPRFPYRGLMLDISRHYRDKDFILKQIDAMAKLKMNRLHLHLTDAAGWRIEIKRYPRLTEYAAWRPQELWKDWHSAGMPYTEASAPDAHGGFLTQADAREIVEYAAKHHITVIPEIEMPSHSEELTAAFPEISCTHNPKGEPDVCIGNEKSFEVIENILTEIFDIFPSKDIHIGGDEAAKRNWKDCKLCQARMQSEGLKDVNELQSYLIGRVEKFVNSKGRNIIGWDEIMEGGLAPNATVMSWRGTEGGIKAAQGGHKAIMTPGAYCYLDNYQDAPHTQPEAIGGYMTLEKVYSYDPVPDSLSSIRPFIEGVQGNLWCEYIPTAEQAEYMLYPRAVAIAEIGWTPQANRNWEDFYRRALLVTDQMRKDGYHTFDLRNQVGSKPESKTFDNHLAFGKRVTYNVPWWSNYNANREATLTDGLHGDWNYTDQRWQGFVPNGDYYVDVTVDLESIQNIRYIGGEFMQITGPGVWFPEQVIISVSDDGKNFNQLKEITHTKKNSDGLSFKTYAWEGSTAARYIRFQSKATEGCQFLDEIVVR